ncbi:MAG: TetR family transcriptional regulator [Rhodobacteraceae bacterium]|nr:TetR family transcriptional regulator [Paracoccaceae bacterium]
MNKQRQQRPVQARTLQTRQAIADGAISVLAQSGVAGLTHRAVAKAANVSLASTTYHYTTKGEVLAEASRTLLDGYLEDFKRLECQISEGLQPKILSLENLVTRVVLNAGGRGRTRSLAWCEIILHSGRSENGRILAQDWYARLDAIWYKIAAHLSSAHRRGVSAAVDRAIGRIFLLLPLGFDRPEIHELLGGGTDLRTLLACQLETEAARSLDKAGQASTESTQRSEEVRERIVQATIDILVDEGASAVSYRAVAEKSTMVRSGPSYYFPTINALLETVQQSLFERAKARYREGLGDPLSSAMSESRLVDLTTAIFLREVFETSKENIGYYSVWMSAAYNPSLRPVLASFLSDQHFAWRSRIAKITGHEIDQAAVLDIQALFVGKLIRAITTGAGMAELSGARKDFSVVIRHACAGR